MAKGWILPEQAEPIAAGVVAIGVGFWGFLHRKAMIAAPAK